MSTGSHGSICSNDTIVLRLSFGLSRWAVPKDVGAVRQSRRIVALGDWGLAPMNAEARHNLLEIIDYRHGRKSTIVTSQLPTDHWLEAIGDATLADAILDRLVHNAHILKFNGESQRRKRNKLTNSEVSA